MAKTTRERFRIECRFECIDPVLIHDSAIAIHLFRIAQEAMSNAIRHGGASSIAIVLSSDPDKIRLQIRDNGCGMDSPKPGHRGMGLHIMKHRAQMIGGEIVFQSSKSGTVITCALPVSADAP
jgi:signal transduction histidine kinase